MKVPRLTLGRLLFAGVAALIVWLVIDTTFGLQRTEAIQRALQRGEIGALSNDERLRLFSDIRKWLDGAGVKVDFAIDEAPKRGRLNVYFTTPAAYSVTGVARGNARYDPSVDAIFIDKFFLEPNPYLDLCTAAGESSVLGCRAEMSSQRMFLAFIFLHELGHRQIHGVGSGAFAGRLGDPQLRKMEAEADAFAVAKLKSLYASGYRIGGFADHELVDSLGFSNLPGDPTETPASRFWIDLLGTFSLSSMLNAFLPMPYSPFYHDLAHPSFNERSSGLYSAAVKDKDVPTAAAEQFKFFRDILERQRTIPEVPFVEVMATEPVSTAAFTDEGLVLVGLKTGAFNIVSDSDLKPDSLSNAPRLVHPSRFGTTLTGPIAQPSAEPKSASLFWSMPNFELWLSADGTSFHYRKGRWSRERFPVETNMCFSFWSGPAPTSTGVAVTCDKSGADWVETISSLGLITARRLSEITAQARARAHDARITPELLRSGERAPTVFVDGSFAFVSLTVVEDRHTLLYGVAILDLRTLSVVDIVETHLPKGLEVQEPARALFAARDSQGAVQIFLVGGGGGLPPLHWGIWKISKNRAPELLIERPFIIAARANTVGVSTLSDFDPYLTEVQGGAPGFAIVNFNGEGVFLVDLKRRSAHLLFGYGGEPFKITLSHDGRIALYLPGGGKVFVFSPQAKFP